MDQNSSGPTKANRNSRFSIVTIIVLLVILAIFTYSIFRVFLAPKATPTPEPKATLTPMGTEVTDEIWDRIQEQGKLVVGVAADYPPFEFYDKEFQLDGLDIALIREIGQILDVEIEIMDIAFDGLIGALQLGHIDVAISAISVTPERERATDFSNIYFVSEDAILAAQGSNISIDVVDDLSIHRVGVQSGTVFQDWLQSELVDTDKMPPGNLFFYQEINKAVDDLSEGRIDLVAMDLPPAGVAASSGVFKIVRQGLNQQRFAIAIPKGATRLQSELNNAVIQLQNSGLLNDIITTYLGLVAEDIPSFPTPTPGGSTPTPDPNACIDAMTFVEHLSFDDEDMKSPQEVDPGQAFRKGWKVHNAGTCIWNTNYALIYMTGNESAAQMGGLSVPVEEQVLPGNTYDLWVELLAPIEPGTYQGFWAMRSGRTDLVFGSRIWVGIKVPVPPTATPKPTQTLSPGIRFSADPTQIEEGDCSAISWITENVKEVYLYKQGEPWQENPVDFVGSREVCPSITTTYEMRVLKLNNLVEVRQVSVFVILNPVAPDINRFTVEPNQIIGGQCVQIQWEVIGDVTNIILTRNEEILWDDASLSGTREDCPPGTGERVYGIEVTGPGGVIRAQRFVAIIEPTTSPPTTTPITATMTPTSVPPTETPVPPTINAFAAVPNQILVGECIQVSWDVGGNVKLIQIIRNGAVILDNAPFNGSGQDCLEEPGPYEYLIEASDSDGKISSREITVNVYTAQPDNLLAGTSWKLVTYFDGDELVPLVEGLEITAVFTEQGEVNGFAGCNIYSAIFTVGGDAIVIDTPITTRRSCDQPIDVMQLEATYLGLLEAAQIFQINAIDDLNEDELTMSAVIEGEEMTILFFMGEQ